MIPKIKALGLAVFAVMAFGALSATAASAAEFHSEAAHTLLSGSQHAGEDTWTFPLPGTARCNEVTYQGTQSTATTSTVTVTPTYSQCTVFGYINGTIHTNGCGYQFHAPASTVSPTTGSGTGTVTIECPEITVDGKKVKTFLTFTAPGICEVKVGSQGPLAGITYTNQGAHGGPGRDLTIDMNITGIKYDQIKLGFCTTTSGLTNGKYVGSATVQGKTTEGGAVGVWAH